MNIEKKVQEMLEQYKMLQNTCILYKGKIYANEAEMHKAQKKYERKQKKKKEE